MAAFVSALIALYQYFKMVFKSLPDPEGLLSKRLPSVTVKATNEAVLAASKQYKERSCVIQACVTIYKLIIRIVTTNSVLNSSKFVIFKILIL